MGGWKLAVLLGVLWVVLSAGDGSVALGQQKRTGKDPKGEWEILKGCQLVAGSVQDGDSFHLIHKERQYIFRLYFVDAPETDGMLEERIEDQAAYFGIGVGEVPGAGQMAAAFTRRSLEQGEVTVITRWENALGRSKLVRFYAVVLVNGKNLAEELVAHGLARIHGPRALWPDGPRSTHFVSRLKNLELAAREQRRGAWNPALVGRAAAEVRAKVKVNGAKAAVSGGSVAPVNLNAASQEELEALPGIGPALAQRIIKRRPLRRMEDLERVPGIGKKTAERLRPLVRF